MRLTVEGEAPNGPADLSFPPIPSRWSCRPACRPSAARTPPRIVREQSDGSKVYEVVDKLRFEDGRIASNTFPFLGLMALGAALDGGDIFSAIVVPMLLGADPSTVTGRVLECPGAQCLGLTSIAALQVGRPLVGAFVSLRSPTTENSVAGRLDPGWCTRRRDPTAVTRSSRRASPPATCSPRRIPSTHGRSASR